MKRNHKTFVELILEGKKRVVPLRKKFIEVFIASLFVVGGVVLLLSNLSIISLEMKWTWGNIYPFLLFIIGVKLWGDALFNRGGSWVFGSFLTIFGGLLLLDRFKVIEYSFLDLWQLWPLIFIYAGVRMFFRKRSASSVKYDSGDPSVKMAPKSKPMVIGDHSFNEENWKVEPMNLWNGVGDYKFDFTKAFIPDEDTPITVRGWVGDVKMFVPQHIPYRVEAKVKTGDIKVSGHKAEGFNRTLNYETDDYETATRRLTIHIDLGVGSIKIVQV
ncbi:cell wall-active antibiotics response protein LiaF [Halobacillus litoralis]|uniref:cell wall-active antibiotics response protein LiaF n=1 Tax=Halobacillus litoralis TaxID=45668 RepID=UPI001CFE0687|nr:cell wall-active antibiotics response protein LiaF [Halobacillus litoralis]